MLYYVETSYILELICEVMNLAYDFGTRTGTPLDEQDHAGAARQGDELSARGVWRRVASDVPKRETDAWDLSEVARVVTISATDEERFPPTNPW